MTIRSPRADAVSVPLRVEKFSALSCTLCSCNRTAAVARVACPHRSISTFGVNHRSRRWPGGAPSVPTGQTKAVSDRANSAAIACNVASCSDRCNKHTAAGLPRNGRSVKASTTKTGRSQGEEDVMPTSFWEKVCKVKAPLVSMSSAKDEVLLRGTPVAATALPDFAVQPLRDHTESLKSASARLRYGRDAGGRNEMSSLDHPTGSPLRGFAIGL